MTRPRDDRLPKGVAPEHLDFIAQERRKGRTWDEIGLTVGVSGKTLSSWWAKRGAYAPEHRRPRRDLAHLKPRACLRCQIMFDSEGPHNRLCSRCRSAD